MKRRLLKHLIQRPKVLASSAATLTTSAAAVPNSGLVASVDNWQGASAAVAELSQSLDTALEQIEVEGEFLLKYIFYAILQVSHCPEEEMNDGLKVSDALYILLELGDINEQLKFMLQCLDNEASMYANSQLGAEEMKTVWKG